MENFLSKGSDVRHRPDGRVERIIAVYEGQKILVEVIDGQPKRRETPDIPYFAIPADRLHPFYRQIRAIIADGEKTAKQFKDVRKTDWAASLAACGIKIGIDGKVIIPRRHTNKITGEKKLVLMPAKDIDSAIRMQDHIKDYYDTYLPSELSRLLKKLAIIQPRLELRREVLLFAKTQMQLALDQAYVRYKSIAAMATAQGKPDFLALKDNIAQLAFLLTNQWANPYLSGVKLAISHLNLAKRATNGGKLQTLLLHLLRTKSLLAKLAEDKLRGGEKLAEIDPIKTLAEVDRQNKADEILALAKLRLGGKIFHLADMLVISREVLERKKITPEPTVIMPAVTAKRRGKKIVDLPTLQSAFEFGA